MTQIWLLELQHKNMELPSLTKETTATAKVRPKPLEEVKAETYHGLKTMAKQFLKFGLVERISMHLQVAPIY